MPIKSKRIYAEASPGDGLRVLTTNYWPRGISRERAGTYVRALAPSRDLLRSYKDGVIEWPEFEVAYLDEMTKERPKDEITRLASLAATDTVTVMCACEDEAHCHRRLLRDLIEGESIAVG